MSRKPKPKTGGDRLMSQLAENMATFTEVEATSPPVTRVNAGSIPLFTPHPGRTSSQGSRDGLARLSARMRMDKPQKVVPRVDNYDQLASLLRQGLGLSTPPSDCRGAENPLQTEESDAEATPQPRRSGARREGKARKTR